jgi:hypothetical protein
VACQTRARSTRVVGHPAAVAFTAMSCGGVVGCSATPGRRPAPGPMGGSPAVAGAAAAPLPGIRGRRYRPPRSLSAAPARIAGPSSGCRAPIRRTGGISAITLAGPYNALFLEDFSTSDGRLKLDPPYRPSAAVIATDYSQIYRNNGRAEKLTVQETILKGRIISSVRIGKVSQPDPYVVDMLLVRHARTVASD